jgi:type IV pilus assembly protein PilC
MEFIYTALTKDGHRQTASIQAPSQAAAGHLLKEQGLLPTEIEERGAKGSFNFLRKFGSVNLNEKIGFIENLSVMLKAGISITRCLQILVKQTTNQKFKIILADVASQVEQGKTLGDALGKFPDVFPDIAVSMVKVGELSGNLDKSLEYLTIQLHREADLKSKVRGAMIYPSVIVIAMVVIGILLSIFVLPSLTSIFKEMNAQLPLTTRAIIAFADFMSGHAVIVIGGMIALAVAVMYILRTYPGQKAFNVFSLHMPTIGKVVRKVNLARFARILSSMLKSGIPIVQALDVAGDSLANIPYKELIKAASVEVKVGKPLAEALGKTETLFPVLVIQMIQVGEESGTVQEILEQLAGHYEEEVDNTLKNLSSIIEPLLLLAIGAIVGLLAVSLISPIYSIYQNAE